ncbi:HEAT repeat containing protein [Drechmeria coniospora]|uniref:HEAT repeat containing protein n=1 Tax=Drechmeria coniospora TaxID=98403 RepID=A0A151GQ43_DRECN|nr:HEAT repeat containing protein [Drechmeria coniospora]KYK59181.1 HEAT repeat containing protein [Drechmeria coniospora]
MGIELMADNKLSDDQVADLLTTLRGDSSLDAKVQFVTVVKSAIKQHNVPDTSAAQLFDGLRSASSSPHPALANAGFTALNHLLTRLSRQDPKLLAKEAPRTLPVVVDKLGDQKDKFRALAGQALGTLYAVAPQDVERAIRNSAMTGKNPRAKEAGMHWLLQMHKEQGLQFRSYVPALMELLEDADGMVRDVAKSTVIELFSTAPNAAKSDLKRQLKNFKVRPAIEQSIVKALVPTATAAGPTDTAGADAPLASRPHLSTSVSSLTDRPTTPMVETPAEPIEPMYVNTHRELEDVFRGMASYFEGKETEQNWLKREQSMATLRKLNAGNASTDFADTFVAGLRGMLDGIIKAMTSLRTSLSKEGCGLVQDVAATLGPAIDPMVELLLQTLVKLSAGTKKISSQQANVTVDTIVSRVTYNTRVMQHIWLASQDKNVAPRTYATGWLKTMLKKEAHHKSHVEHTGGVDLMEKCIKKGLGDVNPGVREKMRPTYWAFWGLWPARADAIMADLDLTAQKLLNKDPNNPNSPKRTAPAAPRPGLGFSKSTTAAGKPSLRETMMAQKKATAMASRNLPLRPGSAMAHLSPVRSTTSSSTTSSSHSSTSAAKPLGTRARPEPTISVNAGGMSVAPMRPARRRPEMAARPATAGPYSARDHPGAAEVHSPESIKSTTVTPKAKETTPRRTAPRPRPGHPSHDSDSKVMSPAASALARADSPSGSPARFKQSQSAMPSSSPSRNEDITLLVPQISSLRSPSPKPASPPKMPVDVPTSPVPVPSEVKADSPSRPLKVFEDPFTEDQPTPKPTFAVPVLEDKPVNEDAAHLQKANGQEQSLDQMDSPEKTRQNSRLLDSGIAKIKTKTLEVHGFRKLQSLIRDSRTVFADDKFDAFLIGLFRFLEDPLPSLTADKAQDLKAQILTTIKLLLKRERENFQPHVSRGLESLLQTRSAYDTRAHVVSGLELLADELITIADGTETVVVLTRQLQACDDNAVEGCRTLSMGLHVLKEMLDKRADFAPADGELAQLTALASRCLESADSGVRMDAVKFCVSLHDRVGEASFWDALRDVKEDPKSLITYYIVKKQREQPSSSTPVLNPPTTS